MANPKPGSAEWQEQMNREVEQHDARQRESGNPNQEFEIAPTGGE